MIEALSITPLPYSPDPLGVFACLRARPGAVLLDSGRPVANGRFDIMSCDPLATLEVTGVGTPFVTSDQLTPVSYTHLTLPTIYSV